MGLRPPPPIENPFAVLARHSVPKPALPGPLRAALLACGFRSAGVPPAGAWASCPRAVAWPSWPCLLHGQDARPTPCVGPIRPHVGRHEQVARTTASGVRGSSLPYLDQGYPSPMPSRPDRKKRGPQPRRTALRAWGANGGRSPFGLRPKEPPTETRPVQAVVNLPAHIHSPHSAPAVKLRLGGAGPMRHCAASRRRRG